MGNFFHRWRLGLWGRVSCAALRVNFITLSGRSHSTPAKMVDAWSSKRREGSPCTTSCLQLSRRVVLSTAVSLRFTFLMSCGCEAPGTSCMAATTSWCGLKASLEDMLSAMVCLSAMSRTVESFELIWEAASPHFVFLKIVVREGRWSPPLLFGRYSRCMAAQRASPAQRFRNLVAKASRFFVTQELESFVMEIFQTRRGQIPLLYRCSFC